ncbi:hypothetical protein NDU88_006553 [Pleurodeles waltl]|uniref:Uncharacterized protein n=1 Tax=Pleurodeles waltl TaxID=8319 RepID=A0AAV7MDR8_PLEWA|nr:hypothetical protein NDU88_006553 [Pleurodeles waltl]
MPVSGSRLSPARPPWIAGASSASVFSFSCRGVFFFSSPGVDHRENSFSLSPESVVPFSDGTRKSWFRVSVGVPMFPRERASPPAEARERRQSEELIGVVEEIRLQGHNCKNLVSQLLVKHNKIFTFIAVEEPSDF